MTKYFVILTFTLLSIGFGVYARHEIKETKVDSMLLYKRACESQGALFECDKSTKACTCTGR